MALDSLHRAVHFQAVPQWFDVKGIVRAHRRKCRVIQSRRQAQQALHVRPQRLLPRSGAKPCRLRLGAAQQPALDVFRPHPQRQVSQRRQQLGIAQRIALCAHQQVRQHLPGQQDSVAVLHRAGTRRQAGLVGKRRQQPLRKGVDGIDAQAAAGAVQHRCEQGACPRDGIGTEIGADGLEFERQFRRFKPHPACELVIDTRRHLGRAGLGECQAQDLRWIDLAAQQQPQHAR